MPLFRSAITLTAVAAIALAQGTESKRAASEFPVQARLGDLDVAAEFMVRLISLGRESFVTDNFLVVEVALFPREGKPYTVRTNAFTLRVNGRKESLFAQPPAAVIASVKYPDWEWQRMGSATAQAGDGRIGMGQPAPVERFPGDPNARRLPRPVGNPADTANPVAVERMPPGDVINQSALPEGMRKTAVSGYVFFPWRGNPAKLKTAELTITDETSGAVTLRLR